MKRSTLLEVAASTAIALGMMSMSAIAATDAEALKCGVAFNKLQETALKEIGKAGTKLCKSSDDLEELTAKIAAKLNKKIDSFNSKYNESTCDGDLANFIPVPMTSAATIVDQLNTAVLGGTDGVAPINFECNNLTDDP